MSKTDNEYGLEDFGDFGLESQVDKKPNNVATPDNTIPIPTDVKSVESKVVVEGKGRTQTTTESQK